MNTKTWVKVLTVLVILATVFPVNPASAQASWNNGDVIQIGPYDIFVMLDGQRHHIPNPETLDAMHISRTQINNKGLNDDQLRAIPQGSDVPDVARDPGGFNDFMNRLYSNPQPQQNPAGSFTTGEVIQIGDAIYVIVDGQRRWVPNPATLDALGIPRAWVNNKGYDGNQLSFIPQGSDIPDVNRDWNGFIAFKNAIFPSTTWINPPAPAQVPTQPPAPQQPSQPVANYFGTGNIIITGDGKVWVIVDGQRRWVPNPATLDALGISRSWIDNKGFSNDQLYSIPQGPDIPDVNRDWNGFIQFKNWIFPNNSPINPPAQATPVPPTRVPTYQGVCSGWNGRMTVGQRGRVTYTDGTPTRLRSQPSKSAEVLTSMPEGYTFMVIGGPVCADSWTWWNLRTPDGLTGWSAEGDGSTRFIEPWPEPQAQVPTSHPNPTATPQPSKQSQQASGGTCSEGLAYAPNYSPSSIEVYAADNLQCTEYLRTLPEWRNLITWRGNAYEWDDRARDAGLTVTRNPHEGDIAVWERGCGKANKVYGHVGYVVIVRGNGEIVVNEANWITKNYPQGDGQIHEGVTYNVISCMSFIHSTSAIAQPAQQQQSSSPRDKCGQYVWWNPRGWWCRAFGK